MNCKDCSYKKFYDMNGRPGRYYCLHDEAKFARSECEPHPIICRTERHEFFRIVPEKEKRETESAEEKQAEVAEPKAVEEKPTETGAETKEKPEPPKPEAPNKKQIYLGKMKALRNAGWSMKQIAEEMQLAPSTVCGYLKKMEEGK